MNFISKLKEKLAHYIDVNVKLAKLNFIQHTSGILGYIIFLIICLFFAFSILLYLSMGLAAWFTVLVDSRVAGFFMTVGVYILLLLLLFALRKNVVNFFTGSFIRIMTENDKDDDEEK